MRLLKNLKKPTYSQKQRISKAGIDPMTVLVHKDLGDSMILVNKETNEKLEIACKR